MEGSFTRVAAKSVSLLDSSGTWSDKLAHSVWQEVEHSRRLIERADRAWQSWDHICRVHDVFYDTASCAVQIVMELADRTLYSEMRRYGTDSDAEACTFAQGLLRAATWLRQCEILHNDIKPQNVLWFKLDLGRAFQWQTKLSDLGPLLQLMTLAAGWSALPIMQLQSCSRAQLPWM
jgi:serine/threonine protein kinase